MGKELLDAQKRPLEFKWHPRTPGDGKRSAIFICKSHVGCQFTVKALRSGCSYCVQIMDGIEHSPNETRKSRSNTWTYQQLSEMQKMLDAGAKPAAIASTWTVEELDRCDSIGTTAEKRPGGGLIGARLPASRLHRTCIALACARILAQIREKYELNTKKIQWNTSHDYTTKTKRNTHEKWIKYNQIQWIFMFKIHILCGLFVMANKEIHLCFYEIHRPKLPFCNKYTRTKYLSFNLEYNELFDEIHRTQVPEYNVEYKNKIPSDATTLFYIIQHVVHSMYLQLCNEFCICRHPKAEKNSKYGISFEEEESSWRSDCHVGGAPSLLSEVLSAFIKYLSSNLKKPNVFSRHVIDGTAIHMCPSESWRLWCRGGVLHRTNSDQMDAAANGDGRPFHFAYGWKA